MASSRVLFTITPRAVSVDAGTLPVSVYVSPRLTGADRLDAFPDWLTWTRRLRDDGLTLSIACGGRTLDLPIAREPLNPDFWEALFTPDTLVRPHVFDDFSDRAVLSYSVRDTLSALKSIYQDAGLRLALPDRPFALSRVEHSNRSILRDLVAGLDVHWNADEGERWRDTFRLRGQPRPGRGRSAAQLDAEGLVPGAPSAAANRAAALPFAVFHHMPIPRDPEPLAPDWGTLLDFHQALGSLDSYPALLRALGIVLDLELPLDFVPETTGAAVETLAVRAATPGWQQGPLDVPELTTGVLHLRLPDRRRLFLAAPRALVDATATTEAIGLLNLDPVRFGLAQVDVDGAMHKAIILAETWNDPDSGRNLDPSVLPGPAPHPEVFDPNATLPSLRSGGLSLFADGRAQQLLDTIHEQHTFNLAIEGAGPQLRPFCAEDLVRGYRLDIWDSRTGDWHSLHLRSESYRSGEATEQPPDPQEGFVQLAVTSPAEGADPPSNDLYLHEAIARWAGWSLSVAWPGRGLSRYADPARAYPKEGDDPADFATNEPVTPFEVRTTFEVVAGSLPQLRFGTRYRVRARVVDLAGNSLRPDDPLADQLAALMALPRGPDGFTYLRYEPVAAPLVVLRDLAGATGPGSSIDRLVIRTFNGGAGGDSTAVDTTASSRHVLPPRTSVELGERLGMFDDAAGALRKEPAMWQLIAERDAGDVRHESATIAGKTNDYPLEPAEQIDPLPYLPDVLARGAALRDLPGTPEGTIGRTGPAGDVAYESISDPDPRPGSATIVELAGADWQQLAGFRLELAEPGDDAPAAPRWDPDARVLTVFLPKGTMTTVPLTSWVRPADLPFLGQWQWLREAVDRRVVESPEVERLLPGGVVDEIAHVLQRAVEGGHWLLTPPRLLTLVHAVQQPLGHPAFRAIDVEHDPAKEGSDPLQTEPSAGRADPTELAAVTAWRRIGATDAYLHGGLAIHGASTAKVDLTASWEDPVDDPAAGDKPATVSHRAHVDELTLPALAESYLWASGRDARRVGWYDPEHDQVAFVREGDWIGRPGWNDRRFDDAAPRHVIGDTKHHRITYTAVATSRYREYFEQVEGADFTRSSEPIEVDVPASARPLAPEVAYVVPTFGWQRQVDTNLMRSVRFGGGLRVYLRRGWYSSGDGELLGVALWSGANGTLDRETFKPYVTQWGMDPIWRTGDLGGIPAVQSFPDAAARDFEVSLEERDGRVDVVGYPPELDETRGLWFADLTVNLPTSTYMPFCRLALVRFQPNALRDAKISRVVLADYAQLTPDRTATVTFDPYHPRQLHIAVSGVAPRGPSVGHARFPNVVRVRAQQRRDDLPGDLGWEDAPAAAASVTENPAGPGRPELVLWDGTATFARPPEPGRFRLLVEELERIGRPADRRGDAPGRLVYAETFEIGPAVT
jgi:hypothetical protein